MAGLSKLSKNDFITRQTKAVKEKGHVSITLKPKQMTTDEVAGLLREQGLIVRRKADLQLEAFTKQGLASYVGSIIEDAPNVKRVGKVYVVQRGDGFLHLEDYRAWANLNGLGSRMDGKTLYIEIKKKQAA